MNELQSYLVEIEVVVLALLRSNVKELRILALLRPNVNELQPGLIEIKVVI